MSNVYQLIMQAIQEKRQITAVYDGQYRELCPHTLGRKNGRLQCLCYQFGGASNSKPIVEGSEENWRCLAVDGLTDVRLHDGEWNSAPNYSRPSTCLDVVDVEVSL